MYIVIPASYSAKLCFHVYGENVAKSVTHSLDKATYLKIPNNPVMYSYVSLQIITVDH